MVRNEVKMKNRMEWSWFRVLIKVEQINDNLFLNTCWRNNKPKIAWMSEVKMSWYEMKMRWKCQAGSITRDIRPREAQVSTDYGGKEMRKRWDFNFLRKREVERSEIGESEAGKEEMEWWAEWRRCEGRLFHNTGAEWKKDLLVIFIPEVTEGRLSVIRDEERVERCGVNERRERR